MLPPGYFALHLVAMLVLHVFLPLGTWNLGASRWWGLPLAALGTFVVLSSVRRFRDRTTIRPFEESSELVTDGFYRYSRNPMYTGLLLSMLGAFVMLGTGSPGLVIPCFVILVTRRFIVHEERDLEARFGADYRTYRKRVRRWL